MQNKISYTTRERELYPIWQSFCKAQRTTRCGRLRGDFAGEINLTEGPDFVSAVFTLDGVKTSGDVEIHMRRSDWYQHGHQYDSRYDHVMLHLVWSRNPPDLVPVENSRGRQIPAVSFQQFPPVFVMHNHTAACISNHSENSGLPDKISEFVIQRLVGQGRFLYRMAASSSIDQALFSEMCVILGSPQNSSVFRLIAERLPWETIQQYRHRFNLSSVDWFAILLFISDLIGSKAVYRSLNPRLRNLSFITSVRHLSRHMWKLAGQRPAHHPAKRMAGLALFINHMRQSRLDEHFSNLFMRRLEYRELRDRFRHTCQPDTIPQEFMSFLPKNGNRRFWGEDLLTEIIGNVIIPDLYYRARQTGSTGFCNYLISIYQAMILSTPYAGNSIFRSWAELSPDVYRYYFIQQGLLHLKSYFCLTGRCTNCPLCRSLIRR